MNLQYVQLLKLQQKSSICCACIKKTVLIFRHKNRLNVNTNHVFVNLCKVMYFDKYLSKNGV